MDRLRARRGAGLAVHILGDALEGEARQDPQCDPGRGLTFVLHGLWPESGQGKSPQWCSTAPRPTETELKANLCMTPVPWLLEHEWAKHGSCMAKTPAGYFKVSKILWDSVRLPDADKLSRQLAVARSEPGLALVFCGWWLIRRLIYSPFGATLTGIRENSMRMHAIGAPVYWRLVVVYTSSATIAGVAGALLTQTNQFVGLNVLDNREAADAYLARTPVPYPSIEDGSGKGVATTRPKPKCAWTAPLGVTTAR